MVSRVAVLKVSQARMLADDAGLQPLAHDEHGCCRAVVGALTAVFRHAPAELREHQHQHPVSFAHRLDVIPEGSQPFRHPLQEACVSLRLLSVRVETTGGAVIHAGVQVGRDELGNLL